MSGYVRYVPNQLASNTGSGASTPVTPGGSNTQLQYNNNGSFGGIAGTAYNGSQINLTIPLISNSAIQCLGLQLSQIGLPTISNSGTEFYMIAGPSQSALTINPGGVHTGWEDTVTSAVWACDYNFSASASTNLILANRAATGGNLQKINRLMLNSAFTYVSDFAWNVVPTSTHLLTIHSSNTAKPIVNIRAPSLISADYLDISYGSTGDVLRVASDGKLHAVLGFTVGDADEFTVDPDDGSMSAANGNFTVDADGNAVFAGAISGQDIVNSITGDIVNNLDPAHPVINQENADWNSSSGPSEILNKPTIHTSSGPATAIQVAGAAGAFGGDAEFTYNGTIIATSKYFNSSNGITCTGIAANAAGLPTIQNGVAELYMIGHNAAAISLTPLTINTAWLDTVSTAAIGFDYNFASGATNVALMTRSGAACGRFMVSSLFTQITEQTRQNVAAPVHVLEVIQNTTSKPILELKGKTGNVSNYLNISTGGGTGDILSINSSGNAVFAGTLASGNMSAPSLSLTQTSTGTAILSIQAAAANASNIVNVLKNGGGVAFRLNSDGDASFAGGQITMHYGFGILNTNSLVVNSPSLPQIASGSGELYISALTGGALCLSNSHTAWADTVNAAIWQADYLSGTADNLVITGRAGIPPRTLITGSNTVITDGAIASVAVPTHVFAVNQSATSVPVMEIKAKTANIANVLDVSSSAGTGDFLSVDSSGNIYAPVAATVNGSSLTSPKPVMIGTDGKLGTIASYTVNTTDDTVTTIATLATAANRAYSMSGLVVGRRTGGTGGTVGDCIAGAFTVSAKNIAGTVTVGTMAVTYSIQDGALVGLTAVASSTNILFKVEGDVDNDVSWTLEIDNIVVV